MNGKILALLLCVALTGASSAALARDPYTFDASAEAVAAVGKNPALPPTAHDDFRAAPVIRLAAATASSFAEFRGKDDEYRAPAAAAAAIQAQPILPRTAGRGEIRRHASHRRVAAKASSSARFRGKDDEYRAPAAAAIQAQPILPRTAGRGEIRRQTPAQFAATVIAWKHVFKTMFDPRTLARSCLATAVYFEARSESQLGQLAVAKVILNRSTASNYPSSICGVVYQGAYRLNGCQFSFACDGRSDFPQDTRAWEKALVITTLALADDRQMLVVAAATHYHADYVDPRWSKSLHRVTKIGRHIFYSESAQRVEVQATASATRQNHVM